MGLYPISFKTIYKDKIWGGEKIRSVLGKDFGNLSNCGESWEVSGVEGNISVAENGPLQGKDLRSLIGQHQGELIGEKVFRKYGDEFPLLIKFIDANADLSIQVHPDDELARKRHDSNGKTEMWYVLQADPGATLISGFNQPVDKAKYLKFFEEGRLTDLLNEEKVEKDDVYFLPAGRVHTIGKGLLIAEIQQTSDITYRIYDFDRTDAEGNKRELHVEEALEAIDYSYYESYRTNYKDVKNQPVEIVQSPYFHTNKLTIDREEKRAYEKLDSFVILIVLEGKGAIKDGENEYMLQQGGVYLIPASLKKITILPDNELKLLETYVP
ncbi:MAG: type I phosphomannose isomerase catalytic subunit [Cyclobacteriaceae bacterium]